VSLVIADVDSDDVLGTVALVRGAADPGRWSIGYWVAPWARRQGVATAAVRLLSRFGFDELGVQRIELLAEPENVGSVAVAEAAGFHRDGLMRDEIAIKGERYDAFMYTLLPPAED
jgi:RimJ/RimL family protein N-acetyltransferase